MNLTSSSFLIYILNRSRTLNEIYFETVSGFSFTWGNIKTTNGKKIQTAVGRATPGNVTITKAANKDEDPLIGQWLSKFCQIDSLGSAGSQAVSGDSLILVPKTTCTDRSLVDDQIIFFNLAPVSFNGWDGDLMNTTSMSRVSIELSYSSCSILPEI